MRWRVAESGRWIAVTASITQQWPQRRQQRLRDDLGAFGGGVDAVGLDGAGDMDQVFVDHGHKGGVVFGGQVAEDLIE